MNKARKNINEIEIQDIVGRWDAEPNDLLERIFIRESGKLEVIQKSNLLVADVNLNQQTDDDLPILEILSIKGDNYQFNEDSWTIWRYSGDEMDINFTEDKRVTFHKHN